MPKLGDMVGVAIDERKSMINEIFPEPPFLRAARRGLNRIN